MQLQQGLLGHGPDRALGSGGVLQAEDVGGLLQHLGGGGELEPQLGVRQLVRLEAAPRVQDHGHVHLVQGQAWSKYLAELNTLAKIYSWTKNKIFASKFFLSKEDI